MRQDRRTFFTRQSTSLALSVLLVSAPALAADWIDFDVPNGSFTQLLRVTVPANGTFSCHVQVDENRVSRPWLPSFSISGEGEDGEAFTVFATSEEVGKRLFGVKVTQGEKELYKANFLGLATEQNNFSLELNWWATKSATYRADIGDQLFGQGLMQDVGFAVKTVEISVSGLKGKAKCGSAKPG
jgi:hypothetical protein